MPPTFAAVALCLLLLPSKASATWSIMVLDRSTGRIGVAGASCTFDVYGIAAFVPGKGAVISQSIGNGAARELALEMIAKGISPDSILRIITAPSYDARVQEQQYAIATMSGEIQFTGSAMGSNYAGQRSGAGILVQGNTLPGAEVLDHAFAAVKKAQAEGHSLEDVLLAGLAAGADAGGDVRCGAQRATSAFVVVALPGNTANLPYLNIAIFGVDRGGVSAVELLKARLARWHAIDKKPRVTTEWIQP